MKEVHKNKDPEGLKRALTEWTKNDKNLER
jgi:hypothetical protein